MRIDERIYLYKKIYKDSPAVAPVVDLMNKTDWVTGDGKYVDYLRDTSLRWVGSVNQRVIDVQESLKGGKAVAWGERKDVES